MIVCGVCVGVVYGIIVGIECLFVGVYGVRCEMRWLLIFVFRAARAER